MGSRRRGWRFWFEAMVKEHHLVNLFWLNFHAVDEKLFRSAQPTPWRLRKLLRQKGIKTVINLRGRSKSPVYLMERAVCRQMGVRLVDIKLASRNPADAKKLAQLQKIFETIEYPALMHCKAGADRSTFAAVFYRHVICGEPVKEALQKEARLFPYGFIAASGAGIIKYFYERYAREGGGRSLIEWCATLDRSTFRKIFNQTRRNPLAAWIADKLLQRE